MWTSANNPNRLFCPLYGSPFFKYGLKSQTKAFWGREREPDMEGERYKRFTLFMSIALYLVNHKSLDWS